MLNTSFATFAAICLAGLMDGLGVLLGKWLVPTLVVLSAALALWYGAKLWLRRRDQSGSLPA